MSLNTKPTSIRRPQEDVVARTWDMWQAHLLLNDLGDRRQKRKHKKHLRTMAAAAGYRTMSAVWKRTGN